MNDQGNGQRAEGRGDRGEGPAGSRERGESNMKETRRSKEI